MVGVKYASTPVRDDLSESFRRSLEDLYKDFREQGADESDMLLEIRCFLEKYNERTSS